MLSTSSTFIPGTQHSLHDHQGNGVWICPGCSIKSNSKLSQRNIVINYPNLLISMNFIIEYSDSERNENSRYLFFSYLRTSKYCWLLCNQLSSCGWLCWQLREQFLYLLNKILMLNSSRSSNNLKETVASFPNEVLNKYLDWEEKWEKDTTQSSSKRTTMNKKMKLYPLMCKVNITISIYPVK